jgi:hypothetical protein
MTLIGIVSEYNWKIDFGTLGTLYKELVVGTVVETPCCALLNEKLTIPAIAFQTVKANGQLRSIDEAACGLISVGRGWEQGSVLSHTISNPDLVPAMVRLPTIGHAPPGLR